MDGGDIFLLTIICAGQLVSGRELELLSAASFRFSQKLYRHVALDAKNIVYSPYSLHSALTLTYSGAQAHTARQMAEVLELTSMPGHAPHTAYHELILKMTSSRKVELLTANALFINPRYKIKKSFTTMANKHYFSKTFNLDLATPEGPERAINHFIANKTHHQIVEILAKGAISKDTALLIVGTFFFNGTWAKCFDHRKTRKKKFHIHTGVSSEVHMMNTNSLFPFKRDHVHGVEILELPFVDKRFGLIIVLPCQLGNIVRLEELLTESPHMDTLFTNLIRTQLHVEVPKFKIETALPLKHILQNMGMTDAFLRRAANFYDISDSRPYITEVEHKAVIEIQEKGTVASAATLIYVVGKASRLPASEHFIANHPFIFFLRDKLTKTILFQGKFSG